MSGSRFNQGDAERLPFDDASFDAVLCECSLCTFADKPQAATELSRVLRPGGRLALSDVTIDRDRVPPGLDAPLAAIACVGEALPRSGYESLLSGAGLEVIATESCRDEAAALAARVHERLRGARLLGLDRFGGSPMATDEAIELVKLARAAIDDDTLGYEIFAARVAV